MSTLDHKLVTLGVAATLGIAAAPSAHATLLLAADVGGTLVCAEDNVVAGACPTAGYTRIPDSLPGVAGTLGLGDAGGIVVGGLFVRGSVHSQTVGPLLNILNSSSLEVRNTSGADVATRVTVSATDYAPPVASATQTGSGTWETAAGSTITLLWFNDPTNEQGAQDVLDRPGLQLDSFTDGAVGVLDSFSHTDSSLVTDTDPFSMTLAFDFTLVNGGALISRGQSLVKPTEAEVPEPATLLLLSIGMGLMGWLGRKAA